MPLLIDGHNLIGQTPGISLSDADDEAKLVMLLRSYSTAKRSRAVIVVFDHGVYGHPQQLNGYGITCYFAHSPRDADNELIRRLRAVERPGEWALVTSDRRVAEVAKECGVPVISAQKFAALLTAAKQPVQARARRAAALPDEKPRAVQLSVAEVDEWLRLFGEDVA